MTSLPASFQANACRRLPPALALLALVVLAGCTAGTGAGGTSTGGRPVATTTVDLPKSYRFAPAAIEVEAGATVTWTNHDNFTHNVTLADGGDVLMMAPGQSVRHTFTTPGLYPYVCSLHPKDMKGSVLVTGS